MQLKISNILPVKRVRILLPDRHVSTASNRSLIPRRAMLYGMSRLVGVGNYVAIILSPAIRYGALRHGCSSTDALDSVPGSNPRMLEKSLLSPADSIAYDLEDSVAPNRKSEARKAVSEFLDACTVPFYFR